MLKERFSSLKKFIFSIVISKAHTISVMIRIFTRKFSISRSHLLINKILPSAKDAVEKSGMKSGDVVLAGGFGLCGIPDTIIDEMIKRKDRINKLTVVSNNVGVEGKGLGKLLENGQIDKAIVSYIGENKLFENMYVNGQLKIELTPQGTIAERIQAAANGVPAFYTPTGCNTFIETGEMPIKYDEKGNVEIYSNKKETRIFNNKKYLLENALFGDISIIKVHKADRLGNCTFRSTAQNFNGVMAKGSKFTIAEADEIVDEIPPNEITLPGIYVHAVIKSITPKLFEKVIYRKSDEELKEMNSASHVYSSKEKIGRRASQEFKEGMYVNLGVGIPLLAADFVDKNVELQLQSENGVLGLGPLPLPGEEDPDTINAGKMASTLLKGASVFGSEVSFGMIRAGRMNLTLLGAMQVSENGDLSNWTVPGKVKGMGGAMDLVGNPEKTNVIVCTEHFDKYGQSKIKKECTLPLTGARCISRIITELAVFDVDKKNGGLTLIEKADDITLEDLIEKTEASFKVADNLKSIKYH